MKKLLVQKINYLDAAAEEGFAVLAVEDAPDDPPDVVPEEAPDDVPDDAPDEVPDDAPDEVPDEAPDDVPSSPVTICLPVHTGA